VKKLIKSFIEPLSHHLLI